jgi:hypothetical protein
MNEFVVFLILKWIYDRHLIQGHVSWIQLFDEFDFVVSVLKNAINTPWHHILIDKDIQINSQ